MPRKRESQVPSGASALQLPKGLPEGWVPTPPEGLTAEEAYREVLAENPDL